MANAFADAANKTDLPAPISAGSAIIGKVGIDQSTPGTTNAVVSSPIAISSATHSNVVAAAADTVLLAANTARKPGTTIANDSTAILYIKLAATGSSSTSYWTALPAAGTVPSTVVLPNGYVGDVCGTWAAAVGAARVTELT